MIDLSREPHVVTWEVTRACQLHCKHCRARAIRHRNPEELTAQEFGPVLEDIRHNFAHPPVMVFTGGDPLERDDLDDILLQSINLGLSTAVAPSVTPKLTPDVIEHWKSLGVSSVSLSIDGPVSEVHDKFRGTKGVLERTLDIAHAITENDLRLQVNTSVGTDTVSYLPAMLELVTVLKVTSWELFFIIPTGRARVDQCLNARATEQTLEWLADVAETSPFRVTSVGAPQYNRILATRHPLVHAGRLAVKEARGFAFIDHTGLVYPSGYLPLPAGSVRKEPFTSIYRNSQLFQDLRNPELLEGHCRECDFSLACGGSRARAFAVTGDLFAEDPACFAVG